MNFFFENTTQSSEHYTILVRFHIFFVNCAKKPKEQEKMKRNFN